MFFAIEVEKSERLSKQIRTALGVHDDSEEPTVKLVCDLAALAQNQQAEIERLNQSLARVGVISPPLTELVNYILGGK
jgi:hypothetical protein